MCVPLVYFFLSAVVLHNVAAGGVYCAKTARARAAALGLAYPGVHGAPYLYGPAHHGTHHGMMPPRPQPYQQTDPELGETNPNMASYKQSQQEVRSLDDRIHKQTHSRNWHGPYSPVRGEYTGDPVLSFPRGRSVMNRESNFEQVKHVAPPSLAEAPGRPDLVNWDPQGRNKPTRFVYNEHDLVVDESVPNRRDMSVSGLRMPQGRGHGAYPSGLTGYGRLREVPVLRSSGITNRAMTSQNPADGRPRRIGFSGRLAHPPYRRLNVEQFFSR
ncbi:uncharacterized protein LOC129110067 [Anoplopoma fimbria]|uniref:uncharacterized protein LOC129110067 n=1 Tax=Anoplopoma fimbria TaxID=229290 RepID=UPI0023EBFFB8|nr:uncharacterized protein LOC129110067 [Anoplopoma fimbria]